MGSYSDMDAAANRLDSMIRASDVPKAIKGTSYAHADHAAQASRKLTRSFVESYDGDVHKVRVHQVDA